MAKDPSVRSFALPTLEIPRTVSSIPSVGLLAIAPNVALETGPCSRRRSAKCGGYKHKPTTVPEASTYMSYRS